MRNDPPHSAGEMLVFAEVVACGSFSEAARRLGLGKASVSRRVAALERRLGAQLLRRTTRRMSLTDVGEAFHARCQRVAEEVEEAERSVGELQAEPRGDIRLAAPMSFGHLQVAPALPAFLARHPRVRIHLDLTDRRVDLVREKFDLSVRVGAQLSGGSLIQRRLCPVRVAVAASPAYLERHGTPRRPEDLERHNCLGYALAAQAWSFSRGRQVAVQGNLSADNGDALRRLALEGHGIVYLPTFLLGEDFRAGRLLRLLSRHVDLEGSAWAIYPESRHVSPKVRALIEHLAQALGPEPEWERTVHRRSRPAGRSGARPRAARARRRG